MIPQNKDTNDFRGSYEKQNNGGYTEIGEKERQEAEIIWELAKKMGARVFEREKGCRFQNLKFEYIDAGTRRNRLPYLCNRLQCIPAPIYLNFKF